jgi:AraC-like DNA-binding protein
MKNVAEKSPPGPRERPHEPLDSAAIPRFLLAVAAAGGVDQQTLARNAGLPGWMLTGDQSMVAPGYALRLWELLEHALDDPYYALSAAGLHRLGEMDVFDYLFMTSATLAQGLNASCRYLSLLTTNGLLRVQAVTEAETTYSYGLVQGSPTRGGELSLQTAVAAWCVRARAATGRPVSPVRVGFAQPATRSSRPFVETFGTPHVDFSMPATTFTFRNSDLRLPLRGADPALSAILRRYAETLVIPAPATWHERFQQLLDEALDAGHPALDDMARRLILSRRSLQRRLAEHGTNWRAELDSARRRRALLPSPNAPASLPGLARRMGYADPRSARRALKRWNGPPGQPL